MASVFILWERISRDVVGRPPKVFASSQAATDFLKRLQTHTNDPGGDKKIFDTITVTVP